jgi:hypothetical protein
MSKLNGLELKRARLVPSSMFASPDAVVRSSDLSRAQKIQILRRWEFDARATLGGDPMVSLGDGGMLTRVRGALAALGALPPVRRSDPSAGPIRH